MRGPGQPRVAAGLEESQKRLASARICPEEPEVAEVVELVPEQHAPYEKTKGTRRGGRRAITRRARKKAHEGHVLDWAERSATEAATTTAHRSDCMGRVEAEGPREPCLSAGMQSMVLCARRVREHSVDERLGGTPDPEPLVDVVARRQDMLWEAPLGAQLELVRRMPPTPAKPGPGANPEEVRRVPPAPPKPRVRANPEPVWRVLPAPRQPPLE